MTLASETPAAIGSPLGNLRARREAIQEELFIDIPVPRWTDPEVGVRYRPVNPTLTMTRGEARRKAGEKDWLEFASADVLIDACVGVYCVVDGKKYGLDPDNYDADWPRFDSRVAKALGIPDTGRAVDVVRALFFTGFDLIASAGELTEWSGMKERETQDILEGE